MVIRRTFGIVYTCKITITNYSNNNSLLKIKYLWNKLWTTEVLYKNKGSALIFQTENKYI